MGPRSASTGTELRLEDGWKTLPGAVQPGLGMESGCRRELMGKQVLRLRLRFVFCVLRVGCFSRGSRVIGGLGCNEQDTAVQRYSGTYDMTDVHWFRGKRG